MKVKKYIDKKSILSVIIDVTFLIALFIVTVASGLFLFRGWTIIVALLGIGLGVSLIIGCAILMLCLLYTSVTNLVWNVSLINKTVLYVSEINGTDKKC